MVLKGLILLIAIWAHIFVVGQWSTEDSGQRTILIVEATFFLVLVVFVPLRGLIKGHGFLNTIRSKVFLSIFYIYMLLVIVMCVVSFSGQIALLLPVMVFLLAIYTYLIFKIKKNSKTTTSS